MALHWALLLAYMGCGAMLADAITAGTGRQPVELSAIKSGAFKIEHDKEFNTFDILPTGNPGTTTTTALLQQIRVLKGEVAELKAKATSCSAQDMKYTGKECWEKDGDLESCAKTTDPQGHQCEIVCKYMKVGLDAIGPDPSSDDSESPGKTRGMAQSVCRRVPKNSKPLPVGTTKGACKKNIQTGKGATKGTWKLDNTPGNGGKSCDELCPVMVKGSKCDQKMLDGLKDDDDFAAAYASAGHTCKRWNAACSEGNNCAKWGIPQVHNDHLKDGTCWKGNDHASCSQIPVDGQHHRLCPCAGGEGDGPDSPPVFLEESSTAAARESSMLRVFSAKRKSCADGWEGEGSERRCLKSGSAATAPPRCGCATT